MEKLICNSWDWHANKSGVKTLVAMCACLLLSSCFSYRPLAGSAGKSSTELASMLKVGSNYKMKLTNGRDIKIRLEKIEADMVEGLASHAGAQGTQRIPLSLVTEVKCVKFDVGLTVVAVAVPIMVVVVGDYFINGLGISVD